jgi:hypothetical protein
MRDAALMLAFFVFRFFRRQEARRRTQRFSMIEQREIANVERQGAARTLFVDDDGDGTSFHAFAKSDAAATSEARVREPFQHPETIILQERLDLPLDLLL